MAQRRKPKTTPAEKPAPVEKPSVAETPATVAAPKATNKRLRHVGPRRISVKGPSGNIYESERGDVFVAWTAEDADWLRAYRDERNLGVLVYE